MGILSWIIMGLIVGIIAKLIMPGKDPGGFIITICIGVAGAFLGGFIRITTWFWKHHGVQFPEFHHGCRGINHLVDYLSFI